MQQMKAMYEGFMAKFDAHHEKTLACQENKNACLECEEPTSVGMESEA
jgi:hypothetical protein